MDLRTQIEVCPSCDSSQIRKRVVAKSKGKQHGGERFWCRECKTAFDEPEERPPKAKGPNSETILKRVAGGHQ